MNVLILLLLIATSQFKSILAIDDIPSSYISTQPLKSLFCNTCAVLSSIVNETLYDSSKDFESLVGFRLDSTGKKIRKQSGWLKLFLSLEDVCDDWKDKYRVAKRKNEYLYLIESEVVNALGDIERTRRQKLETEAKNRLNAQWGMEWEIEQIQKEIEWNKTHDEMGNLIDKNGNIIDEDGDMVDEQGNIIENNGTNDAQNQEKTHESQDEIAVKSESESEKEKEEKETPTPRYFHEKKPKLVKKKAKQHKIIKDMCYFLSEQLDDWLHEKQKTITKLMKEGDDLKDYLEPLLFCLEGKVCKAKMFDITPKIYKFKKELHLPKKPKRTWVPPNKRNIDQKDQYEEEMEDDVSDNNGTQIPTQSETGDENNGENNDENKGNENEKNDNDNNNDEKAKTEL